MSGKTTLISLLSGLFDCPQGMITLNFRGVPFVLPQQRSELRLAGLRSCYQNDPLFPELSIWENIWLGLPGRRLGHRDLASYRDRVASALSRLSKENGGPRDTDFLSTLSGGGRAIVRVLRSVIWRYKLLLLDEPLANVDPTNRELLFQILKEHTSSDATVLLISHDDQDHAVFRDCFGEAAYAQLLLEDGHLREPRHT
jgi:ABC-type sugar transport system ATPase subunit